MIKTTWAHIRRSPYQAFAAIFIMMQTFFVISAFTFITFGSAKTISYFESVPQATAFFKDTVKQEDIEALRNQVNATGKATKVRFVSKDEAFKIYKEQNKGEDPLLMDLVSADILPPSLGVSANNLDDLASIANLMKQSQQVERVEFRRDIVDKLKSWTNALRKIGVAFIAVLSLDSIFLMVIIIGIKISQKKEEIEIMRLLSASNGYIRSPFLLEGMFYGIIGAVLGWGIASSILLYETPFLHSFLGEIPLLPVPPLFLLAVLGGEILGAIILGWFASFLAVFRYLK
jgi:cell division transport system permease protein